MICGSQGAGQGRALAGRAACVVERSSRHRRLPAVSVMVPPRAWIESWSGRRDSNPRHSAWEADTLPTELLPPDFTLRNSVCLRARVGILRQGRTRSRCAAHDCGRSFITGERPRHAGPTTHLAAANTTYPAGVESDDKRRARLQSIMHPSGQVLTRTCRKKTGPPVAAARRRDLWPPWCAQRHVPVSLATRR